MEGRGGEGGIRDCHLNWTRPHARNLSYIPLVRLSVSPFLGQLVHNGRDYPCSIAPNQSIVYVRTTLGASIGSDFTWSDFTWKESYFWARPDQKTRSDWPGIRVRKTFLTQDFASAWPRFRISLTQKWVWPNGTFFRVKSDPGVSRVQHWSNIWPNGTSDFLAVGNASSNPYSKHPWKLQCNGLINRTLKCKD